MSSPPRDAEPPARLDLSILMDAYAVGVFPMADSRDSPDVYWVEPRRRAILPLDGFHASRRLLRTLKSGRFETTADRAFADVVRLCGTPAPGREETWINPMIADAVNRLHLAGCAHSIETWEEGELVGGLYGIRLGRAFFGESMFSTRTDASKVALAHLVARLRAGGFMLLDCQFQTPHLQSLGAIEISQSAYKSRLSSATSSTGSGALSAADGDFGALDRLRGADEPLPLADSPRAMVVPSPVSIWRIWQSLVQTS
ncbi:MAG: leucyl/phenylalanyl-tRNA--protein transferase [Sphingomonadales bacterium]|nr:leucyl/phenylalanyl-tRNA--protein transferase [Sphingomonadales bacterium]